jgi:hypothetical protein
MTAWSSAACLVIEAFLEGRATARFSCFSNHFPSLAQMILSREHITQTNSHHRSIVQFRLR